MLLTYCILRRVKAALRSRSHKGILNTLQLLSCVFEAHIFLIFFMHFLCEHINKETALKALPDSVVNFNNFNY